MPLFGPEAEGRQTKIGWSRPKTVIFWPFLAFEGRFGGLKDLLEVGVEVKTCRTIHGTHLEGILSQKNWTGLAGVLRNGRNQSKYDFCSVGWPLLVKNPFFPFLVQIGPNHSEMVPNGPKVVSDSFFFTILDHFWIAWTNYDQIQKKWFFCPK